MRVLQQHLLPSENCFCQYSNCSCLISDRCCLNNRCCCQNNNCCCFDCNPNMNATKRTKPHRQLGTIRCVLLQMHLKCYCARHFLTRYLILLYTFLCNSLILVGWCWISMYIYMNTCIYIHVPKQVAQQHVLGARPPPALAIPCHTLHLMQCQRRSPPEMPLKNTACAIV